MCVRMTRRVWIHHLMWWRAREATHSAPAASTGSPSGTLAPAPSVSRGPLRGILYSANSPRAAQDWRRERRLRRILGEVEANRFGKCLGMWRSESARGPRGHPGLLQNLSGRVQHLKRVHVPICCSALLMYVLVMYITLFIQGAHRCSLIDLGATVHYLT